MAKLKPELKQILDRYGIDPRDTSQVWDCHGTLVLYHKAYEVIAAKENIVFDPPQIIEGNSEKKTVAILVVGRMGDRVEWSFGECAPGNNKNSYPYAMAEKRAKDRVIAKLVGLAQYVYSEDEADEFKDGPRKPVETGNGDTKPPPKPNGATRPNGIDVEAARKVARDVASLGTERFRQHWKQLTPEGREALQPILDELKATAEAADKQEPMPTLAAG